MIHSLANSSPRQKSNWREKLRRMSSSLSGKPPSAYFTLQWTPKSPPRVPSLSNSPSLTPGSIKHIKAEDDLFLTPLDVLDNDNEVNNLLDNQIGMNFGDWTIPPPPPRRKHGSHPSKFQLLPAKALSGPRIKPFIAASSRFESSRNEEICFICNDGLETKLDSENLVPLECGDCVHGACLETNVDMLLEKSVLDGVFTKFSSEAIVEHNVLPVCRGKFCVLKGRSHLVSPIAKDLISDLIADVMLYVKLAAMSTQASSEKFTKTASLVLGVDNRVSRYYFKDNQLLRPKSITDGFSQQGQMVLNETQTMMSDNLLEGNGKNTTCNERATKLLEEVKNVFIKHMISRYSDFNLVILVSLGSLRLVDKLHVATGEGEFSDRIVYLFSNFIVIETEGTSPTLFSLDGNHSITTPETSVIQFVTTNGQIPALKLSSETDAVIEKWGIALSDTLLLLPSDVITSSINMSELFVENAPEFTGIRYGANKNTFGLTLPAKGRVDQRISMVLIIEPKEIWSDKPDTFAEEVMRIGAMPLADLSANVYDTESTSPLHIIRPERSNGLSVSIPENGPLDIATDSEYDSDSDIEMINEAMHRYRI